MNILIVLILVLPILFFQGILFTRFIENKLQSAAYGTLILGLIFIRTAMARISGGEVAESSLLAHPENNWLRFIFTSEYAYGVLHFLLVVVSVWFFFETRQRVEDWQANAKKEYRGRLRLKLKAMQKKAGQAGTNIAQDIQKESSLEFGIEDLDFEELNLTQIKVKSLYIEELFVAKINKHHPNDFLTTNTTSNTTSDAPPASDGLAQDPGKTAGYE